MCYKLCGLCAMCAMLLCSLGGRFCCEETVFIMQTVCICYEMGGEVEETVKH